MKHIFICGAKSIGQYGGYETFVHNLAIYSKNFPEVKLHILCKANGEGAMDERKLADAKPIGPNEFEFHGAHCVKIAVPSLGPATAIWYDKEAVEYCLRYCEQNHIQEPIFYILTCRIGPFIAGLKHKIKKLNGQLFLNPDGHEWLRQKWPRPVRKYWKISEQQMVRSADLVICDSVNIEKYIQENYKQYSPKTTYISYGAELKPSPLPDSAKPYRQVMQQNGLTAGEYYLVVCRFVPENNIETILREFMHTKTTKKLLVIATPNEKLYQSMDQRLHFSQDPRIVFPGVIYDTALLRKLRENAFAYLHGHEVGGTNPSLLEGLSATNLNLLLDVPFNREVALDTALYWTKAPGSLAACLQKAEAMPEEARSAMGELAKERIRTAYSWLQIARQYRSIWNWKPAQKG